jgi:hypothetical protein
MTEDTKSLVPIRYQQYGITVKLTPDKHDKTHATFGTLSKTYPTLDHHTLGVKAGHGHQALHSARLGTLSEKNATAGRRRMSIAGLAHLRVSRYFIKNMRPFSHCEDASYHEQASTDWVVPETQCVGQ